MFDHPSDDDQGQLSDPQLGAVRHRERPDLTVIVPTRNEADNVDPLLDRIASAAGRRTVEVLFVDDSDDDTPDRVRARAAGSLLSGSGPQVRLLHRSQGGRVGGLGGAVVAGLRAARADWAVVMDGDLQHPPELAVQLADVGRARDLDLVVATRHVEGGNTDGLAAPRRVQHRHLPREGSVPASACRGLRPHEWAVRRTPTSSRRSSSSRRPWSSVARTMLSCGARSGRSRHLVFISSLPAVAGLHPGGA